MNKSMLTLIFHAILWTTISIIVWRLYSATIRPSGAGMTVTLRGDVIYSTERSFRFATNSAVEWVPRSQVMWDAEAGLMHMPLWLARNRGYL